jgi:mRNA-degrading endonuclease toxin of MazEF toxin-antitoxin module
LKAWDIFSFQPPGWPEAHPCVIISHPNRVATKPEVTIVMCSSKQAARPAKPHEVILDQADGLDWPTLCKCDLLRAVAKVQLKERRGHVTLQRRRQIIATINRANDWV